MKKIFLLFVIFFALSAGNSFASIREGDIDGKNGFSFSNIKYSYGSLQITIRNKTNDDVNFSGDIIFYGSRNKILAVARIQEGMLKRHSSRKFKASFTRGTGHTAEKASYLEWDF